jgi:hypothetical protein
MIFLIFNTPRLIVQNMESSMSDHKLFAQIKVRGAILDTILGIKSDSSNIVAILYKVGVIVIY